METIGSTHYNLGKKNKKLLKPLTQSEYSLKETLDAAGVSKRYPKDYWKMKNASDIVRCSFFDYLRGITAEDCHLYLRPRW